MAPHAPSDKLRAMTAATTSSSALTLRLTCGLLASAARFVPVPLLDDALRAKAIHLLVARTLSQHQRTYATKGVAPLWSDGSGCLSGCLLGALQLFSKLLVWPFRKLLGWVLAAKYLAYDLSETVLLGRTLDRLLEGGALSMASDAEALGLEASQIRAAFDNALAGTDMKLLRGVLAAAVRSVRGLPRAALAALRRVRDPNAPVPTDELPAAQRSTIAEGAAKVEAALSTPDMLEFLAAFDARFDENLAILVARAAPPTRA